VAASQASGSGAYLSAGLDEAGLGPLLGPFALGCVVLEGESAELDPWSALSDVVAPRRRAGESRLVVADSKHVFDRTAAGAIALERVALAFAAQLPGAPLDGTPSGLWSADVRAEWSTALPRTLPLWAAARQTRQDRAALGAALRRAGLRVQRAAVRVVPESALNEAFDAYANKSRAIWSFVAPELRWIFETCGERAPRIVLDRQGGRTRYAGLLAALFPEAELRIERESPEACVYELAECAAGTLYTRGGARRMRLEVRPRAEQSSFETALASCLAKYARELCMHAFNSHFARYAPDLRPTAGYVQDGRRWLEQATPSLRRAGIEPARLVRRR
jgi:ribonuclease HII